MLRDFIAAVVARPVTATMVTIAVVLFGVVAVSRLPVELLPDLSYPTITVRTSFPDAAPREVEELVARPVEEMVGAVPGVMRVESTAREGESEVSLDFAWGTSMDVAMADVREKLDRVRLPLDAERPIVLRYDPAQEPILRLALSRNASTSDPPVDSPGATRSAPGVATKTDLSLLREHADRLVKRELEKLPGVAAVQIHGGDEDEILVEVDAARIAALGVSSSEIVAAIGRDNVNRPGGAVTDGKSRYLIRTVHEARTPQQVGEVIVRSRSGAELHLRDVARVRRAPSEREELALLGSSEAIELAVYREGDANTVAVANAVQGALAHLPLEPDEHIAVLANQATFIESSIDEVTSNVLVGGALAILVLLFFLRELRSTLVIALAIPISLLATFVPLRMLDVSLNLMSLGGLALGVGMLVDNSIVVLESIARVRDTHGVDRPTSAIEGTAEIAPSVVASTLTTVAVFLPMAFVDGVAGQLVRDLSYAVSFSMISSMLVSLTLVPVLQALQGSHDAPQSAPRSLVAWVVLIPAASWWVLRRVVATGGRVLAFLARPFTGAYDGLERSYGPVLERALAWRWGVVLVGVGICAVSFGLASRSATTLLPEVHRNEFYVQLSLPHGTALERTTQVTRKMIESVTDDPTVDVIFARVGSFTHGTGASGSITGTHLSQVDVRLRDDVDNRTGQAEEALFTAMEQAVAGTGAMMHLDRPELFTFEPPIEVQIFAEDPERAVEHARRLLPDLEGTPQVAEVVPDDLDGRPEVRVQFDRERLGRLGIGVDDAAAAVQRALQGEIATVLQTSDRQLDVRVQLPHVDRDNVADVAAIQIGVVDGVPIRLSSVAEVSPGTGPSEIRRIDGRRGLRVQLRARGGDLGATAAAVRSVLARHERADPTVSAFVAGQADEMERSLENLTFAALLAMFMVYVVMASSFESFHHPFIIMFTVPMALSGALLACLGTQTPISAMVGIGGIILGGIVVNNAIVLVSTVNLRRSQGHSVQESLLLAGSQRIRPILMTTATTILGLAPMALGLGEGAALRQPLAISVIGGLTLATLLTLVVIPCIYSLVPGRTR